MGKEKYVIQDLLDKYTNRQISEDEYRQLLSLIKKYESVDDVELFMDKDWKDLQDHPFSASQSEALYQGIIKDPQYLQQIPVKQQKKSGQMVLWRWVASSAAVIAIMFTSILLYKKNQLETTPTETTTEQDRISYGGNKATITLSNGEQIVLREDQDGIVVGQKQLTYNDGSKIAAVGNGRSTVAMSQTIATPRGGTYQITLPDGTKVWLNADTKLTYSTQIQNSTTRTVKIEGEGYFEVAKDKYKPFIVESQGQTIRVLGTHFNVSSYPDENSIKTTLVEGLIQVNNTILTPNQQAVLQHNRLKVKNVDASKYIAWKDGKFVFKSESLESIMQKIARWYDVEIIYKGDFSDRVFTGSISRYDDISRILDKISLTQAVSFKVTGRRIIVMP